MFSWETFTGKTFPKKSVATFSPEILRETFPEKVSSRFVKTRVDTPWEKLFMTFMYIVFITHV